MYREAAQAAAVAASQWIANAEAVAQVVARLRAQPPRAVVTCARGSSDHAATYAKYLIETRLGLPTASAAPSISSLYASPQALEGMLYLAISQSGKSPDLLAAVRAAKAAGAFTLALVNVEDSPLAETADAVLPLHAGRELSVAATKSYIGALIAIVQLVGAWSGDAGLSEALESLPLLLSEAWRLDWSAARSSLAGASSLYVIGRGVGFGVAQEAALKLKETCGLHAEAFSAAEVLHGPMALVKPGFPVIVFAQNDETHAGVLDMAGRLAERGAKVWLAGAAGSLPTGVERLPTLAAHPALQPILLIQSFYALVASVSLARGYDPDCPPNLKKVTETV